MPKKRFRKLSYTHFQASPLSRLAPLFCIIFLDSFGYFLIIPVLLRLFINHHYDIIPASMSMEKRDILYSIALMLSPLAFIITSPLMGHLSDKFGRKKTMLYCLYAAVIGFLLPIIGITNKLLSLIFIGRFIAGASTCNQPIAQAALTDISSGKKRAFYLGLIGLAMTLAMVLGPIAGGYLSDHTLVSWFNITTPYYLGTLLAIFNVFLLLVGYKDEGQVLLATKKRMPLKDSFSQLWQVLKKNNLLGLLFTFLLLEIGWSQYYQSIFLYLSQHFHYSADQISLFTAYAGLWMSLGLTVVFKLLSRHYKLERVLLYSLITAAIGLIGCSWQTYHFTQWIFIVPAAIGTGVAYPALLGLLSNRTSAQHQGWVMGTASTVLGLAWMITGFSSGVLTNVSQLLPLLVAAVVMLLSTMTWRLWFDQR